MLNRLPLVIGHRDHNVYLYSQSVTLLIEMRVSKKGISPVIATLLLILIAIAAGVAVYMYVTAWIGTSTSTTAVAQAEIQIDAADLNSSSDELKVWIRNIGGTTATITSIYLLDSNGAVIWSHTTISGVSLSPGSVYQYTNNSVTGTTAGYSYVIKVVCSDGASTTYTVKAHS